MGKHENSNNLGHALSIPINANSESFSVNYLPTHPIPDIMGYILGEVVIVTMPEMVLTVSSNPFSKQVTILATYLIYLRHLFKSLIFPEGLSEK